jgi:hypothetical protein
MWDGHNEGGVERKARVVIIDGGVEAQGQSYRIRCVGG